MDKTLRQVRIELLLLFALLLFIMPRVYMDYDMGFWRQWALYIRHHGVSHAYDSASGINYFPVFIYLLGLFDVFHPSDASIAADINSIKMLLLCFDFLPVVILCAFRQKLLSFKIPYLYLLLNIAYLFDTVIWGQIDSIYVSLSFLAILSAFCYPATATLLYVLALNTKPQAIEFAPILLLGLWYGFKNSRQLFVSIFCGAVLELILLLPFMLNGTAGRVFYFATHSVDLYNKLSICAFNIWYLIAPGNPYFINDKDVFFILSYKVIGMLLFGIATIWVLIPLFKRIHGVRKHKLPLDDVAYRLLFLGTGMICFYFFYCNSQMHERYAQPVIIFFFFYGVVASDYKLYILASIPYVLSLDKCMPDYLPIQHYKIIFASKAIAIWYALVAVYGTYLYWREANYARKHGALPTPHASLS
jgi:Gpi18-like mannosyltransferase